MSELQRFIRDIHRREVSNRKGQVDQGGVLGISPENKPAEWLIDGGGAAWVAGVRGFYICHFPYGEIVQATMVSDVACSAVATIEKTNLNSGFGTWTTISSGLAMSAAPSFVDRTLTGWLKSLKSDDILRLTVSTPGSSTLLLVSLKIYVGGRPLGQATQTKTLVNGSSQSILIGSNPITAG